jgi:hypothetical protein
LPALQVPEGVCLSPLHAQKVGGARHVDIQKGSAHEEIGGLGRDVLGELRQSLLAACSRASKAEDYLRRSASAETAA